MHRTIIAKAPGGAISKRGARLLALAVVSDQLLQSRDPMPDHNRRALQRVARGLYRSLPDASRTTYVRHLRERHLQGANAQQRQRR